MHLPKLAAPARRFRGLGGWFGLFVNLSQRKIAINITEPIAQLFDQFRYCGVRQATVGALVIPVFDQRQRRIQ